MKKRVKELKYCGTVENRDAAAPLLTDNGDTVIVERGIPRLIIMRCPCGCGDDLLINLDKRSGKAWRHYLNARGLTLFPSYWRDNGCKSHFIIWNSQIYWCFGWGDAEGYETWSVSQSIEDAVYNALPEDRFVKYDSIAAPLDVTPWEVLQACRQLVKAGKAEVDKKSTVGSFRRTKKQRKLSWLEIIFGNKNE